jgi:hypothetical protein
MISYKKKSENSYTFFRKTVSLMWQMLLKTGF